MWCSCCFSVSECNISYSWDPINHKQQGHQVTFCDNYYNLLFIHDLKFQKSHYTVGLLYLMLLCSSQFKSFAYLYNEDQFMAALSKDVKVVKTLPKNLKGQRKKKNIPSFKVPYSSSPYYYKHHVLPILKKHSVVELVVSDGGCLQVTMTVFFFALCYNLSLPSLLCSWLMLQLLLVLTLFILMFYCLIVGTM